MSEQLDRRLGLQTALDAVEGQGWNSFGELRLGNAGLHAHWLDQHVATLTGRWRNIVQPHVVEIVESPGFHRWIPPRQMNFCKV